MLAYTFRRILAAIPVMVTVAVFVFLLLRLTPGDPAAIIAGDMATPEQLEKIRASLGLDKPIAVQFFSWLWLLLQGDLGTSLISNTPVTAMIAKHIEPTVSLALLTITLSVLIAVPLGVLAAWRHGTWIDYAVMSISVIGFSVPVFVIGYILIQIFAIDLKWFPVQGFKSLSKGIGPFLERAVLPSLTLASIYVALIARMTRASVLEVLGEDYIRTARAKGLKERRVILRHAFKAALVSVIPVLGIQAGFVLGGAVYIETVFQWPGIGSMLVTAISTRDLLVVQGGVLVVAAAYVLFNLAADVVQTMIDPRLR